MTSCFDSPIYYEYYIRMSFNLAVFYTYTYNVLFGVQVVDLFLTFVREIDFQNLTAHDKYVKFGHFRTRRVIDVVQYHQ